MISLKVSDESSLPTAEDRLSHKKMAAYRSIETEGDGMKSYVATCVALLLGQRPVCLIDEPEMCLHPPQAYNLGRFIGRFGASPDTATFVATHSSYLLRGIIQTASQVQIVRLTRKDKSFSAHLVPAVELREALSRPTLRAEAVLDGIFAQAVIVVEADGDRAVYQAVWETLSADLRPDIHFATVGGTGGIADTCRLYRTLHIPIAVIADLDILVDEDRMTRVLDVLIEGQSARDGLARLCKDISEEIRCLPPEISPEDLLAELTLLSGLSMDWNKRDDIDLKFRLGQLKNRIDRMRRLKKGGIRAYSAALGGRIADLLGQLGTHGLFLVPVGELEEWLADYGVTESKTNKSAWANSAAQRIQQLGKRPGDVWEFINGVGAYLGSRSPSAQQTVVEGEKVSETFAPLR